MAADATKRDRHRPTAASVHHIGRQELLFFVTDASINRIPVQHRCMDGVVCLVEDVALAEVIEYLGVSHNLEHGALDVGNEDLDFSTA